MSIPRFAIERPVMMTMISCDHRPDRRHLPRPAAGRSAARHLAADDHRPRELHRRGAAGDRRADHPAARAAAQRRLGPRADELVVERGQFPGAPELHLGPRPQRSDGRDPDAHRPRARPPARGRRSAADSEVRLQLGADHGPRRRELRRHARPRRAARARRAGAVAAPRAHARRRGGHGERRPAAPDPRRALAREDHRPRPVGRPRRQRAADREPERADRRDLPGRPRVPAAQPGTVRNAGADRQHRRDDAHRRAGLPQGHRRGEGHDRGQPVDPAHQRARRASGCR